MKNKINKHNYKMAMIMRYALTDDDLIILETQYDGDIDKFLELEGFIEPYYN
jgi:hypothetical protein